MLGPLWDALARLGSGGAVLVAVPGNHDLFRPNPKDGKAAVRWLLHPERFGEIADEFWSEPAGEYCQVINHAFAPWRD